MGTFIELVIETNEHSSLCIGNQVPKNWQVIYQVSPIQI